MNKKNYQDYIQRVNNFMQQVLPSDTINLHNALHYSTNSGKRLRSLLVYVIGEHLQVPLSALDAIAASIEFIHAYSLIHDDLPCMDDDDLRRGKPTTHIKFSEAIALLAGDALQGLAFEVLSDPQYIDHTMASDQNKLKMIRLLASAIGAEGMVLGQQLDLNAENSRQITLVELQRIYDLKTGQLFKACLLLPCYCGSAPDQQTIDQLTQLSYHLGLAFQIQDDLLDLDDHTITGKSTGSDQRNSKTTYLSLLGEAGANQALAHELACVKELGQHFPPLLRFVIQMLEERLS